MAIKSNIHSVSLYYRYCAQNSRWRNICKAEQLIRSLKTLQPDTPENKRKIREYHSKHKYGCLYDLNIKE